MLVSKKRPDPVKVPVKVTDRKYELWYLRPVLMGTIEKEGRNWYTEDLQRHLSSWDALDYLIKLRETIGSDLESQIEQRFQEKIRTNREAAAASTSTTVGKGAAVGAVMRKRAEDRKRTDPEFDEYMKNRDLFREFKQFIDAKQKSVARPPGKTIRKRK